MRIVFDAGFFSSLFKIKKLELIKELFQAEEVLIPKAVYAELLKFRFFNKLPVSFGKTDGEKWIKVVESKAFDDRRFGSGELEAIYLAKNKNFLLLIDDFAASNFAKEKKVLTLSLASFLLACKENKILPKKEMNKIIADLKKKDYYEFSAEVRRKLLE